MKKVKNILIISSDKHLRDVLYFCFDGWGYEVYLEEPKTESIISVIKKVSPDAIVIDIPSTIKVSLEICRLIKEDFMSSSIPIITLINKRQLREQLLTIKTGIDDYLIKPPDPLDLRTRIEMAIKRAHYSFCSHPLTGLPGGKLIEDVLREKLDKGLSFSFGYIDIDNFKYFNDIYGYIKGDRVIIHTAYILYNAIKRFGENNDLIGHIGGDDFVFITSIENYRKVCQYFIMMFENLIPFHYPPRVRERGYILAKDRTRKIKKVPLMSVSIALVNRSNPSEIKNILELNERVAEVKQYLKSIEGSKFMADRRNTTSSEALEPQVYRRQNFFLHFYKPLGQILLDLGLINSEQLDLALSVHWRKGVILGEILKELGFLKEEDLTKALSIQKASFSKIYDNLT